MQITLCALVAGSNPKQKKACISAGFSLSGHDLDSNRKNKHMFYNEIILKYKIFTSTIILIEPGFHTNSLDPHEHGSCVHIVYRSVQ
jgi:hypothetical protein